MERGGRWVCGKAAFQHPLVVPQAEISAHFCLPSNVIEPYKRDAEPQLSAVSDQSLDLRSHEAKDFLAWLLKAKENQSSASLEGSDDLKDAVNQEFLTWLMSTDLCRPWAV
uniref:Glucagon n=1 Tax=Chrysolophus pictus TaxID=9089 RepID=A0A8C3LMW3_CHRPC